MRRPWESHAASWRSFLCRVLWLHRPEWRVNENVRVSFCSRCQVIDDVQTLHEGVWS